MAIPRLLAPEFCVIAPTDYLQEISYYVTMKRHLVLAHLVDTDHKYAEFYANRTEYKIMDNGAFELGESYDPNKLIELGRKCKADAIVLPDYPFQPYQKTIEESEKLKQKVIDAGFATMFVPQSEPDDLAGLMKCYEHAANDEAIDIIGMSILALPNAITHIPKSYARVVIAQYMLHNNLFNHNKYHHWLGLQDAALEIPPLIEMKVVDSLDSSNPVQAALCGHVYNEHGNSFLPVAKNYLPDVNFQTRLDRRFIDTIVNNIDLIDKWFN